MASDIYARVGARLQALRKAHGVTQNDLAEKASVGVSYLVKIEGGVRKARLEVLERLAAAMGEPIRTLFDDGRLTVDEKKRQGEARQMAEILPRLSTEDARALVGVALQLAGRRRLR